MFLVLVCHVHSLMDAWHGCVSSHTNRSLGKKWIFFGQNSCKQRSMNKKQQTENKKTANSKHAPTYWKNSQNEMHSISAKDQLSSKGFLPSHQPHVAAWLSSKPHCRSLQIVIWLKNLWSGRSSLVFKPFAFVFKCFSITFKDMSRQVSKGSSASPS